MHKKGKSFDSISLPTSYQVSNTIEVDYLKAKEIFKNERLPLATHNGCAVTFDFSQSGPDYGVMTLHFIDNYWYFIKEFYFYTYRKMKNQILEFTPYPMIRYETASDGQTKAQINRKTAENVDEFVKSILHENGWSENEINETFIVTDEATNLTFGPL